MGVLIGVLGVGGVGFGIGLGGGKEMKDMGVMIMGIGGKRDRENGKL